jgi:hypothetical protein
MDQLKQEKPIHSAKWVIRYQNGRAIPRQSCQIGGKIPEFHPTAMNQSMNKVDAP